MTTCPRCHHQFQRKHAEDNCPSCSGSLTIPESDRSASVTMQLGTGEPEKSSGSDLGKTISGTVDDVHLLPKNPAAPGERPASSGTVAIDPADLPSSSGRTLNLDPGSDEITNDGGTVEIGMNPPADIGKTMVLEDAIPTTSAPPSAGKTVVLDDSQASDEDFSLMPPVAGQHATVSDSPVNPEAVRQGGTVAIDDFSLQPAPADDSGRTIVMDESAESAQFGAEDAGGTVEIGDPSTDMHSEEDSGAGRTMILDDLLDEASLPGPSGAVTPMAGRTFVLGDAVVEKIIRDTMEVSRAPQADKTVQLGDKPSAESDSPADGTIEINEQAGEKPSAESPPSNQPRTVPDVPGTPPALKRSGLVVKTRSLRRPHDTFSKEGDYELLKILGEGGMGVVYTARQSSIHRTVAVKMIKPGAKIDDIQKQKFLAEAVVTGDLEHPNIVPIYDLGTNEQGALFYSMKKVQGTPWDKTIQGKSLPENLEILMKVADAVGFAHSKGVIHRDLKPENVMIGEFGEVLVMDWGLAISVGKLKEAGLRQAVNMGGTPAYMSPEMVTGPFDKIGAHSDIYLLGAILFEIITGDAPHTGATPMKCLHAAARNEIRPTEKVGELMDVARRSMLTNASERYASVKDFQSAIREYQSHAESIFLSSRAEEDYRQAQANKKYERFSRAVFGFQESLALWTGNSRARQLLSEVQLAYARLALERGDFDLGLSVLDLQHAEHVAVRQELLSAQKERESRQQRLKNLRRAAVIGTAAFILVVVGAFFWIKSARDLAEENRVIAEKERVIAEEQRQEAVEQRHLADERRIQAEAAQKQEAVARKEAEVARKDAVDARDREEYEAYIALIGLAAAKIEENEFGSAREILNQTKPSLRNWEWGRLMHLCSQGLTTLQAPSPVDAVAYSPDGKFFVTGGWNGAAQIWNAGGAQPHLTLPLGAKVYVHAVAVSPDAKTVATAGSDRRQWIRLWNAETGKPLPTAFDGHTDTVLSVSFSPDGTKLLTSSYDKTARIWDVSSGKLLTTLTGHTLWVWQAEFSSDSRQIVTVSQDGTALIWSDSSASWSDPAAIRKSPPFAGHQGAVYTAAFSPDGSQVVTGGWDKRVLVWKPADLKPLNFAALSRNESPIPDSQYLPLEGHLAAVRSVGFSPDGRFVISGAHDNTVKAWDAASGKIIKTFRGHDSWVRGCCFSPDGEIIVSVSYDHKIKLWSVSGYGEERVLRGYVLQGHTDAVLAAAFSPDEKMIVTASRDNSARTWDVNSGRELRQFQEGHAFLVTQSQFSRDGRQLFTSAVDNTVRQWDITTGTQLRRFDNTGRTAVVALSPDGKWMVTASDHLSALLWSLEQDGSPRELTGHKGEVTAAAFSPDGSRFVTGDESGRCLVWDSANIRIVAKFTGHTRRVSALAFVPGKSNSELRILSASGDNTVANWDAQTGRENPQLVLKHPDEVLDIVVLAGARAVTACRDHLVRQWDLAAAKVLGTIGESGGDVHDVAASADGKRFLTIDPGSRIIRVYDSETRREILFPKTGKGAATGSFFTSETKAGPVWSANFSPEGNQIATLGGREARLWDARTARELMSFNPHGTVASANFAPDGKKLVTGFWDNSARIWMLDPNQPGLRLRGRYSAADQGEGHTRFVNSACYSPDGKQILTASDDKTAKLWDAATGKVIRTFEGHHDRVRSAMFSSDGTKVLTASADKTAKVWETSSGKALLELSGHRYGLLCAVFSLDGRRIATGSDDNSARLWDAANGKVISTLEGHTAAITSVAFSPDGRRLLTGSQDFLTKLWDADTHKEILTLKGHSQEVTAVSFAPSGRYALTGSRDGTAIIWLASDWHTAEPATKTVSYQKSLPDRPVDGARRAD